MKMKIFPTINIDSGLVLLGVMMFAMTVAGSYSPCSCYKFYSNTSDWENSRNLCQATGGDLVSIETPEEWEFINKQITTKTTESGHNHWWIGLHRKSGSWVWSSNYSISYDKWKAMSLSEREKDSYIFAVIDKVDGTFMKAKKFLKSGKICEYKEKACVANQTKWCSKASLPSTTSKVILTTTKATATMTMSLIIATKTPTVRTHESYNYTVFQPLPTGESDERSVRGRKKKFPYYVLVVALAVVLLVCIGVLIVVWINKSRKRGAHSISQRRKSSTNKLDVALDVQYTYDQYPEDFSDQGGNALTHDNDLVIVNNSIPEKPETKTHDEEMMANHEESANAACVTENACVKEDYPNKTEEEEGKEEDKALNEEKKSNDKPDAKVLTTFITKIEEEDDVFYGEEAVTEQQGDPVPAVDGTDSSKIFTYATISETEGKSPDEGLYAEVNDENDEDGEHNVTYAEIAEFSANSKEPVKKPTPYYPTEYASVTVHPLSPRFSND